MILCRPDPKNSTSLFCGPARSDPLPSANAAGLTLHTHPLTSSTECLSAAVESDFIVPAPLSKVKQRGGSHGFWFKYRSTTTRHSDGGTDTGSAYLQNKHSRCWQKKPEHQCQSVEAVQKSCMSEAMSSYWMVFCVPFLNHTIFFYRFSIWGTFNQTLWWSWAIPQFVCQLLKISF